ncbi:AAA-type ATPase, N-terminal domain [Dillenia turbinata]|uniref:AAA-type ATPase, N-terminal domain n=1 Tax=Dillenia turbinata TaxID=194707 RepID=A0AAN8Z0T4_9MAGN
MLIKTITNDLITPELRWYQTGKNSRWVWIKFDHPETFDAIEMELELKKMIIDDLDSIDLEDRQAQNLGNKEKPSSKVSTPKEKTQGCAHHMSYCKSRGFQIPSTKTVISAAASAAATAVLLRSLAKDYIPHELRHYLYSTLKGFLSTFSSQLTIVIDEFNGFSKNTLFQAAETYLGSIITPSTHRFRAILPEKASKISLLMEQNSEIIDNFNNIPIRWRRIAKKVSPKYAHHAGDPYYNPSPISDIRYFEMSFHKKHKHEILTNYVTPAEVGEQLLKHDGCENALRGLIEFLEEKYEESQKAEAKRADEVKLGEASIESGEVDKKGKGIVNEEVVG